MYHKENERIGVRLTFSYDGEASFFNEILPKYEKEPLLLDISSIMYDLELLHDLTVLITMDEYSEYKFSEYFWYRKRRPIRPEHRIRAIKIVKESPLIMEIMLGATFGAPVAFLAMLKSIEMLRNWDLNREKLELEVKKLRKESNPPESNPTNYNERMEETELRRMVHERRADKFWISILRRLDSNPIYLVNIEVIEEKEKQNIKVTEDYLRHTEMVKMERSLASLSSREREILQLAVEGKSSLEVAKILNLSHKTVETHRSRLMRKLGVKDNNGLIQFISTYHGLVSAEQQDSASNSTTP